MAERNSQEKEYDKKWYKYRRLFLFLPTLILFLLAELGWQPIVDYLIWVHTNIFSNEYTNIIALIYLGIMIGGILFGLFKGRINSRILKLLQQVYKPNLGKEFEKELAGLFAANGYKVEMPSKGKDFGADLIIEREGIKKVVQLIYREKKDVGLRAVQEVGLARDYYRATEGIVITNQDFTDEAKKGAYGTNIKLLRGVDYKGVIVTQQV